MLYCVYFRLSDRSRVHCRLKLKVVYFNLHVHLSMHQRTSDGVYEVFCFFFFWASSSFHNCLAALDFGAGVEQPFGCLIVQNRQAVQSMGRSMDWTLEDNMVDGLFFCATLTGRRGGHTPFVQAGTETSDTEIIDDSDQMTLSRNYSLFHDSISKLPIYGACIVTFVQAWTI